MKYWVYIDDQVLPQPYGAEELSSIPGFNEGTLICPEVVAEGEEQQWTAAGELIGYSQPVEDIPAYEEEIPTADDGIYDASEDYNPAPIEESYEPAPVAEDYSVQEEPVQAVEAVNPAPAVNNEREQLLLDKIEYLINEISGLKKDIANLHEQAYALTEAQKAALEAEAKRKNVPIIKDAVALKAFQSAPLIPINENEIHEESLDKKSGEPVVLKAPTKEELPPEEENDILESAIENTMRLKMPVAEVAPVAFDLASKETIEIHEKEKPEEPAKEEVKEEIKEEPAVEEAPAVEELLSEEPQAVTLAEEPVQEEPAAPAVEEAIEEVKEEPVVESEIPVEIASVGNNEEEAILKTFAEEKQEEAAKEEATNQEIEALQKDMGIDDIAEPVETPAAEPAFEQVAPVQDAVEEQPVEEEPVHDELKEVFSEQAPQQETESIDEDLLQEAPAQEPQPEAQPEGEVDALAALTTPPGGQPQEGMAKVEAVDDQFLKTFASSIEEISLDQPTSIISDYVPPTISSDNPLYDEDSAAQAPAAQEGMSDLTSKSIASNEDMRQVKRIKPAAIKTVPMVAAGDPIGADYNNTPNIEEAIAELNTPSPVVKTVKTVALLVVLLAAVLGFVAVLAAMGILPKEMSPVHYVINTITGPGVEETLDLQETTTAPAEEALPEEDPQEEMLNNIVTTVKGYTFVDGTTLEGRIKAASRVNPDQIQWVADTSVDPAYYSIAVKLPPNNEGYSLTYRFSYNSNDGTLTATTSESNNIMSAAPTAPTPAQTAPTPRTSALKS